MSEGQRNTRAADHRERYGEKDGNKELRAHRETKTWGVDAEKAPSMGGERRRDRQTDSGGGREAETHTEAWDGDREKTVMDTDM